jgi:hypothetical protein
MTKDQREQRADNIAEATIHGDEVANSERLGVARRALAAEILSLCADVAKDAIREDMLTAGFDEDFVEASLEEMGFRGGRGMSSVCACGYDDDGSLGACILGGGPRTARKPGRVCPNCKAMR